jgi:inosine-uridine nucleoside N-ribohydrolase
VIAADVLQSRIRMRGTATTTLGDAGALAVALWPDLAAHERHPVAIELQGRFTRGMSVVDRRRPEQIAPHNDSHGWSPAEVIWTVDADSMRDRVFAALAAAPAP